MARTPEELFRRQVEAMNRADLDAVSNDYAEDAQMINGDRVTSGREAIRALYAAWLSPTSQCSWEETRQADGQSHFYWTSTSTSGGSERVTRGHDTIEAEGDLIKKQTIYVLE